jgi:hypothetical protein
MPRLSYLTGLALLLLAGAFLLTDALTWRPGVTERNVRRIKVGMTVEEARGILGVDLGPLTPSGLVAVERGKGGTAWVVVGAGGRVENMWWNAAPK